MLLKKLYLLQKLNDFGMSQNILEMVYKNPDWNIPKRKLSTWQLISPIHCTHSLNCLAQKGALDHHQPPKMCTRNLMSQAQFNCYMTHSQSYRATSLPHPSLNLYFVHFIIGLLNCILLTMIELLALPMFFYYCLPMLIVVMAKTIFHIVDNKVSNLT